MKQFSILRYLKQFRLLIFLVSIIGALLVLLFGISQQHYIRLTVKPNRDILRTAVPLT